MNATKMLFMRFVPTSWIIKLQAAIFNRLNLTFKMPSGINIAVMSRGEWFTYNDIWVEGVYDAAIRRACNAIGKIRVLDLGANVGFFALRCGHICMTDGKDFLIYAVEGSPTAYEELHSRVSTQTVAFGKKVRLFHGLAGKRDGAAEMLESHNSGLNSVSLLARPRLGRRGTKSIPYVDLDWLMKDENSIELLKCDIEGSEQDFIENYSTLFAKVKVAIFEFHHDQCDVDVMERLLGASGLRRVSISHDYSSTSVRMFARNNEEH